MNTSANGHPSLSREQIVTLAECIASMDGITVAKALRQIASFMACDMHGGATGFLQRVREPGEARCADELPAEQMVQLQAGGR